MLQSRTRAKPGTLGRSALSDLGQRPHLRPIHLLLIADEHDVRAMLQLNNGAAKSVRRRSSSAR
jgi:hypothetical protein